MFLLSYNDFLQANFKKSILTAQYRATVSVNRELLVLYHSIGEVINEHKTWGSKFVENLAADIKIPFPDATGYSVRNLKYMEKFAAAYPGDEFVQRPVAQIPWGHNIALLDKLSDTEERFWYAEKIAENGWSRNVLVHQIESWLYQRQVLAEKVSNFESFLIFFANVGQKERHDLRRVSLFGFRSRWSLHPSEISMLEQNKFALRQGFAAQNACDGAKAPPSPRAGFRKERHPPVSLLLLSESNPLRWASIW